MFIDGRYYARRRPTASSYRSVTVSGADGYQLQAPPVADSRATSGYGYGSKYKRSDNYDGRRRRRDSATSPDSWSLCYADGQVDRDGYTHIWELPLPGAPPSSHQNHVTAAGMLVPVGDGSSCPASLVYKCRGGTQQGPSSPTPLPLPPPLPALDFGLPSSCPDATATSSGELSNYYQLDTKDDDQSPLG